MEGPLPCPHTPPTRVFDLSKGPECHWILGQTGKVTGDKWIQQPGLGEQSDIAGHRKLEDIVCLRLGFHLDLSRL